MELEWKRNWKGIGKNGIQVEIKSNGIRMEMGWKIFDWKSHCAIEFIPNRNGMEK